MNLCSTQRSGCVLIKCDSRPVLLAQPMTSQYVQEIEMEMPMKTSLKFVLLAIGLSNVMMLPAPAQQVKSRNQGCDNKTTSRNKTLRPDNRCLSAAPEKYRHQQYKYQQFMKATPPSQLRRGPNGSEIFEDYNKKGEWYRIVHGGGGGWASDGSAPKTGGGSGGQTSAR